MEELKKLVKFIENQAKSSGNALLNLADNTNLEALLFSLVKDNTSISEKDAIQQLYGKKGKADAFKMLKSRVKKKLYNQLHFVDVDNEKKYSKLLAAEIKCNALLNEAIILNHNEVVGLRAKLTSQALKIAKDAELTRQIISALEIQQSIHGFNLFHKSKFYEISQELESYYELQALEGKASNLYQQILVEIRLGVKNKLDKLQFINESVETLSGLWMQTRSSFIYKKYYVSKTIALELFGSISELVTHLEIAQQLYKEGVLSSYHFYHERNLFGLTYAYLKNRQFKEGFELAEQLKIKLDSTKHNWFAHMENYFLLATHSNNFLKAKEILIEVYTNSSFEANTRVAQERWYLYQEFYTLITTENLGYTLNYKLSIITQDKHGYNVWYLILQFLKVLQSRDSELIERDTERLRKYSLKHYGPTSDPRTRIFLKLLLIAGQEHLNVQNCKRKSRYLISKLEQTPFAGDAYAEVEIIPYEHLWEWVLKTTQG